MDSGPPKPRRGSLSWWLTLRRRRCAGAEPPADICAQIEEPRAHSRRRARHGASRSSTCAHLPISRADRQACARARSTSPHWRLVHHPTERQPLGRSGDRFLRTGRHPAGPPQWGPAAPGDRHPRRRGDAMPSKKQKTNGKAASTAPMRFAGDGTSGTDEPRRRCATQDVHRRLLSMVPGYAEARDAIENTTLARTLAPDPVHRYGPHPGRRARRLEHRGRRTSPTSRSTARSTCSTATSGRTNPDVGTCRRCSQRLVADARIEFVLADDGPRRQPDRRASPGRRPRHVVRRATTGSSRAPTGGADAWPADRYLNMWVCPARAAACWATPSSPAARPRPTAW